MFAFVSKIFSNISYILTTPVRMIKSIYSFYLEILNAFASFVRHFTILRAANISLGKYHLQNNNLRDAALRFWIVDKFFAPGDCENLYWYSWVEIFRKNYSKAIKKLENNEFDKYNLQNYIQNLSTTNTIPFEIYNEYISLSEKFFLGRYIDKKDISNIFLDEVINNLPKEWDDEKNSYKILESFSNPSIISEISKKLPLNNQIDAINYSCNIYDIAKEFNADSELYSSLKKLDNYDIEDSGNRYDIILSFDSLSFTLDLERYFSQLKNILNQDGKIIILLPKARFTKLQPDLNRFVYNEEFIINKIKLAELKLISIKSFKINNKFEYFTIIAQ